jgi:HK97 family phage prohead protease
MDVITKATAAVEPAEDSDEFPNGAFELILSAPTEDRDGEVIEKGAFNPLPDHIPMDIDHEMSVAGTVGSGTPFYDEDGMLRVKGGFASTAKAQEARALVNEGHIRTASVAFIRKDAKKAGDGVRHITKAELLNGAFVAVPSNRDALVLASKSALEAVEKVGARNSRTDAQMIQTSHDHMVALGATCATPKDAARLVIVDDTVDPDEDTGKLAQAIDAALDEAVDLLNALPSTNRPAELDQAIALLVAAEVTADALLARLGVPDPDDGTASPPPTSPSAPATRALSEDHVEDLRTRAELYRVINSNT